MYGFYDYYSPESRARRQRKQRQQKSKNLQKAITTKNCPNIKHFYQETNVSCGPASIKMVLKCFDIDSTEYAISRAIGRTDFQRGTSIEKLIKIADIYNLDCQHGNNATFEQLTQLTDNGWRCILHYSVTDTTHYAVFLYDNQCGHIFLNDPFFGPHLSFKKNKFLKKWKCQAKDFPNRKPLSPDTIKWFAAFRPKSILQSNEDEKQTENEEEFEENEEEEYTENSESNSPKKSESVKARNCVKHELFEHLFFELK